MTILLIILIIFLLLGMTIAPVIFMQVRKTHREQKNYERGLKIIPVLIHLPPSSDDTEAGMRDTRDIDHRC